MYRFLKLKIFAVFGLIMISGINNANAVYCSWALAEMATMPGVLSANLSQNTQACEIPFYAVSGKKKYAAIISQSLKRNNRGNNIRQKVSRY